LCTGIPGGFVVSWTDFSIQGDDTSGAGIKAQIFGVDGTSAVAQASNRLLRLLSDYLRIDEKLATSLRTISVEVSNGGFVVSWTDFSIQGDDTSGAGIKAQIFGVDGTNQSSLQQNRRCSGQQSPAAIAL
jgi:hypothetical protein